MSQFRSLPSFRTEPEASVGSQSSVLASERSVQTSSLLPPTTASIAEDSDANAQAVSTLNITTSPQPSGPLSADSTSSTTGSLRRMPNQPLYDIETTQSLVLALQASLDQQTASNRRIVIPGSRKKKAASRTTTQLAAERDTDSLERVRTINPRVRYAVVFGIMFAMMLTSLLTLTPLGHGQTDSSFSGVIGSMIEAQNFGWSIVGHKDTTPKSTKTAVPSGVPEFLSTSEYVQIARDAAIKYGINPDYFVRQIYSESSFNPNAVSPSGAVGIAQFMPSTAAGLGINPWDPVQALYGSAKYMSSLQAQWGGDYAKALASYNAGSGVVQNAINQGGANWMNFLPAETRNYLTKIMGI
ncbi:lytic transglycosylase domain-containing protein [Ktedonospora formicarum]|uniref:Transglycosylase SLT domain-containing protein n=1 Tax=Ktedonospora formicarum TaxID=2778364 RepID=A0A8J3MRK3_9CHLR|nr:lytic transglycosylase domain-containing protein [Ktedonospora formicarum]GHO43871.1 hypothetical protein KSX_20340 [Ktedonospora formicarum]